MSKGPKLNRDVSKTRRDNLGLNSAFVAISTDLCPIINNVTPTVFYWIFFNWIYYDYKKKCNTNGERIDRKNFLMYLKQQDYYFIAGNYLAGKDMSEINGKDNIIKVLEKNENNGRYKFDRWYLKSDFGGLNYYEPGLTRLGLITESSNSEITFPVMTNKGEKLALEFENVIKDTEYFKKYRWKDQEDVMIPRDVLIEFGKKMNINLVGFDDVKKTFKEIITENEKLQDVIPNLFKTMQLLIYLKDQNMIKDNNSEVMRRIFFEDFSPKGKNIKLANEELIDIIRGWEVAMIRQYFTIGIELIWNYMLIILSEKSMNKEEWISSVIEKSKIDKQTLNQSVESYYESSTITFDEIQDYIKKCKSGDKESNLINGIKIMFSVVRRLDDRNDLENIKEYLIEGEPLSIQRFKNDIKKFQKDSMEAIIQHILKEYIIDRHRSIANKKLILGRDGFYFDYDERTEIYTQLEFSDFDLQGLRLPQAYRVAERLEII